MEFITTEKFNQLGYTFKEEFTPNNLGTTYHVIVTDKDGNEVVHTQSSYANATGRGYAMSGVQHGAVAQLEAIINGEVAETKEEYDTDFLNRLANDCYITEYGYTTDGELLILFDSWEQVEGEDERTYVKGEGMVKTGNFKKSVYAKLRELAEKDLLKPSINKTIKEVEYGFTDSYGVCRGCGKIINREWEGLRWIESTCEELCNDCINESEEAIESLIEEAKDNFSKALPVMVDESKIENLGYERVREDSFEDSWNNVDVSSKFMEELCKQYNGFAKLTCVGQWGVSYTTFFPTDTVEQARTELFAEIGE